MCVPKPAAPVQAANSAPSMQAASALELAGGFGGAPRGAAQLGRLALRMGRDVPVTASKKVAPVVPSPAAPAGRAAINADVPGVGTSEGSLAGLRFGNYGEPYQ